MHAPHRTDHYQVLGIPRSASASEVKRAFREQVKRFHPDLNSAAFAAERFRAVHAAYQVLNDPGLRSAYDQRLRQEREEQRARADRNAPHSFAFATPIFRRNNTPPTRKQWLAYKGLHITGLLFGTSMVLGILTGIVFGDWPWGTLLFVIPGLAVLPDSWEGLRE